MTADITFMLGLQEAASVHHTAFLLSFKRLNYRAFEQKPHDLLDKSMKDNGSTTHTNSADAPSCE
jgi:hypothetical protein